MKKFLKKYKSLVIALVIAFIMLFVCIFMLNYAIISLMARIKDNGGLKQEVDKIWNGE